MCSLAPSGSSLSLLSSLLPRLRPSSQRYFQQPHFSSCCVHKDEGSLGLCCLTTSLDVQAFTQQCFLGALLYISYVGP